MKYRAGPRRYLFTHRSCPLLRPDLVMLTELRICAFRLDRPVNLELATGFQVLTGETGAGGSILIDAIADSCRGPRHCRSYPIGSRRSPSWKLLFSSSSHPVLRSFMPKVADGRRDGRDRASHFVAYRAPPDLSQRQRHSPPYVATSRREPWSIFMDNTISNPCCLRRCSWRLLDAFGDLTELRGRVSDPIRELALRTAEAEAAERDARDAHAQEDLIRFQYGRDCRCRSQNG